MSEHPPHLPPKACSLQHREPLRRVFIVIALTVLGLFAGVAGALMAEAWILPQQQTPSPVVHVGAAEDAPLAAMEQLTRQQLNERVVTFYDRRERRGAGWYTEDAIIGRGIVLSRDGWVALYLPETVALRYNEWDVIDHRGNSAQVQQFAKDPVTNMVYVQLTGENYRGDVRFASVEAVSAGARAWALQKEQMEDVLLVSTEVQHEQERYAVWEPVFAMAVEQEIAVGTPLVTPDGAIVGMVGMNGTVIPARFIEMQLPSLFGSGQTTYVGLPVWGYPVSAQLRETTIEEVAGFFVTQSYAKMTSGTLFVGDVITHIGDQRFDAATAAQNILFAEDEIVLRVLRGQTPLSLRAVRTTTTPRS